MVPSPPPQPQSAAQPRRDGDREKFLIDVAAALEPYRDGLGVGIVSRIAADAQRKHREPLCW